MYFNLFRACYGRDEGSARVLARAYESRGVTTPRRGMALCSLLSTRGSQGVGDDKFPHSPKSIREMLKGVLLLYLSKTNYTDKGYKPLSV